MIRIGTVWDRTTDVLAGRGSILAGIALMLLFLPSVIQAAIADLMLSPEGARGIRGVLTIVVAVLTVWGTLSLTVMASDPAVTRDRAFAIGASRLGAALAIILAVVVLAMIAAIPGIVLLSTAGFDWARAQQGLDQVSLDTGKAGLALLYFLAYAIVWLWISARFVPLLAVVVNERLGLGAFRRSLELTRGSTLKLIGVIILYAIVLLVAVVAASAIVGLVFRLILGSEAQATVTFLAGTAAAAITAGFSVLQSVFGAQFYRTAQDWTGRDGAVPAA